MNFIGAKISGVYLIDLEQKADERGFLARVWDRRLFAGKGIGFQPAEGYLTLSKKKGTLRGFHHCRQKEQKLTRVTRGSVYEVVIDVRPESPTFKNWQAFTLRAGDYKQLYLGPGIAHAILALEDETEFLSFYSPAYEQGSELGIRYNDPAFSISWPIPVKIVSKKDLTWEDFK